MESVEEWVRRERLAGFSDEQLRESMLKNGFTAEQADQALASQPARAAPKPKKHLVRHYIILIIIVAFIAAAAAFAYLFFTERYTTVEPLEGTPSPAEATQESAPPAVAAPPREDALAVPSFPDEPRCANMDFGRCECNVSDDCITSDALRAGVCKEGGCWEYFAPATPEITGDTGAFCEAYINDCAPASLTFAYNGSTRTVGIEGPGAFENESCTLRVADGGSEVSSGTAALIADTVSSCRHNLPIYLFWSVNEPEKVFCCGYDIMYAP